MIIDEGQLFQLTKEHKASWAPVTSAHPQDHLNLFWLVKLRLSLCCRFHLSTDVSAAEVRKVGLQEVARIKAMMEAVSQTLFLFPQPAFVSFNCRITQMTPKRPKHIALIVKARHWFLDLFEFCFQIMEREGFHGKISDFVEFLRKTRRTEFFDRTEVSPDFHPLP